MRSNKVNIEKRNIEELLQLSNNDGKMVQWPQFSGTLGETQRDQIGDSWQKELGIQIKGKENVFNEVIREHYPNAHKSTGNI